LRHPAASIHPLAPRVKALHPLLHRRALTDGEVAALLEAPAAPR